MRNIKTKLSMLWICLMLTYLLGDVLRIFSGDFEIGMIEGTPASPTTFLWIAVVMLLPILMIFLSQVMKRTLSKWINIAVSVFLFAFNLFGLFSDYAIFDVFLIVVSLIVNIIIVIYAIRWKADEKVEEKT